MLVCALALSVAAHFFAVFPLDLKITHELQEEKNTVFAFAMKGVSAIGDTWPGIVMVGAAFVFYIVRRQLLEAVFILVTLSNFVLTSLLKVLVTRPRPSFFLLNPADAFQSINQYIFRAGMSSFLLSSLVSSRSCMASSDRTCPHTCHCSLWCPYSAHRCLTCVSRGTLGK